MSEIRVANKAQYDETSCPKCGSNNIRSVESRERGQEYKCANCEKLFVEKPTQLNSKHCLPKNITPNEMRLYDIWDLRILGKKTTTSGEYTVTFMDINFSWLKSAIKDYLWAKIAILKTSTIKGHLVVLKQFSEYIDTECIIKSQSINRQTVLGFINYLSSKNLSGKTRSLAISSLKNFLEYCQNHKILEFYEAQLIFSDDYPKREKSQVKNVPSYILKQLDGNLCYLARPIALQTKILRETGMRISEVCRLNINCIQPDSDGDWWINVYREKMEKENRLLITKELAQEILEQQKFIRGNLSSAFAYLFCSTQGSSWFEGYTNNKSRSTKKELNHFVPVERPLSLKTLRGYLYYLATECKITDVSGDIYPIWKCHQFRHTHLTDCVKKGMGIAHVMQRAGHLNPAMSMEYIHLTDGDQKKKMKEVWDNAHFNLEGEIVASPNPELDIAELQWIKKGMNVQTSDNGYCTLLATQNCPYQTSPCKECGSWVTTLEFLDAHKKELDETEKIIENARQKEWQRQVEKNVPRAERLKKIINGMENHKTMKGLGHNEWEKEEDNASK